MAKSKPTHEQMRLFDFTTDGEEVMRGVKARRWFYLSDVRKENMIVIDFTGRHVKTLHDLQTIVPWLTNSRKEATRVALQTAMKVRIYPYDPRWKQMSAKGL